MRYLVVLNGRSELGTIFAADAPCYESNGVKHPILECVMVSTDGQHYLYVVRERSSDAERQTMLIPHHAVLAIHEYEDKPPAPFGFTT
jgi:hypothetical protein